MRRRLALWLPPLLWAALLLALGSQPSRRLPPGPELPGLDKALHATLYGVLGFLAARARGARSVAAGALAGLLSAVLCGALDEWNQASVEGRSSDAWDLLADAIGGGLGGWIRHRTARRAARSQVERGPDRPLE